MGLVQAVRGSLTQKYAKESGNTAIATMAMTSSVRALDAVGKRSQGTATMASAVPVINGTNQTQAQVHQLATKLGHIVRDAELMARLKPVVTKAAQAYAKGEADRLEMLKAVGAAQQKVAIASAKTQHEMFVGHTAASVEVGMHQGAYSGQGFRV